VALFIVTENACHEDFGQKPSTEGRECYMWGKKWHKWYLFEG
jgi:hypothetical protein